MELNPVREKPTFFYLSEVGGVLCLEAPLASTYNMGNPTESTHCAPQFNLNKTKHKRG